MIGGGRFLHVMTPHLLGYLKVPIMLMVASHSFVPRQGRLSVNRLGAGVAQDAFHLCPSQFTRTFGSLRRTPLDHFLCCGIQKNERVGHRRKDSQPPVWLLDDLLSHGFALLSSSRSHSRS